MRQLHVFEQEERARTLADAMYSEGIDTSVKEARDGGSALWVHDDDDMEAARSMLEQFEEDPKASRFVEGAKKARAQKKKEARKEREVRRRTEQVQREIEQSQGTGPVTKFLLLGCVGFAVMGGLLEGDSVFRFLAIADYGAGRTLFESLRRGEVWRLFSHIFVYPELPGIFPVIRLLVDLWWLKTLATPIEQLHRGRFLLLFVLLAAPITGVVTYLLSGPLFGTLAGLVAALFAYIWIRQRVDPTCPLAMPPSLGLFILLFAVLSFFGRSIDPPALWLSGFAYGATFGWIHARIRMRRR